MVLHHLRHSVKVSGQWGEGHKEGAGIHKDE